MESRIGITCYTAVVEVVWGEQVCKCKALYGFEVVKLRGGGDVKSTIKPLLHSIVTKLTVVIPVRQSKV